jgi:hypothetical protein
VPTAWQEFDLVMSAHAGVQFQVIALAPPDLGPVEVATTPEPETAFVLSRTVCHNAPIKVATRPYAAALLADLR